MIDAKDHNQRKPKIVVGPRNSPGQVAMRPDAAPSQDRIRERAYELYDRRGREPGQDLQDWLRAEREILKPQR